VQGPDFKPNTAKKKKKRKKSIDNRTGGVAEAVECLLCKCEVLNSNPSPTKKKKKKLKFRRDVYIM
jgi:hypothetical protein